MSPYNNRVTPLLSLYQKIESVCKKHPAINSYHEGEITELDTQSLVYPAAFLENITLCEEIVAERTNRKNSETYSVSLNLLDRISESSTRQNTRLVKDRLNQVFNEIKAYLQLPEQFGDVNVGAATTAYYPDYSDTRLYRLRADFTITVEKLQTPVADLRDLFSGNLDEAGIPTINQLDYYTPDRIVAEYSRLGELTALLSAPVTITDNNTTPATVTTALPGSNFSVPTYTSNVPVWFTGRKAPVRMFCTESILQVYRNGTSFGSIDTMLLDTYHGATSQIYSADGAGQKLGRYSEYNLAQNVAIHSPLHYGSQIHVYAPGGPSQCDVDLEIYEVDEDGTETLLQSIFIQCNQPDYRRWLAVNAEVPSHTITLSRPTVFRLRYISRGNAIIFAFHRYDVY